MEKKELICIGCPMGCALTVETEDHEVLSVAGNTCPRGESYARKEVTNPTRIVTTTVRMSDSREKTVSVKTETEIPKGKIFECVRQLKDVEMKPPVHIGDIVLGNAAGTGVNVVATREVLC